ncbi:MAG: hypothetical protein EAZ13_02975 [Sphingobacteriia bacterium]|nr:MAG: hypothetical protein EAZ35_07970 [Sphingobacteriia bacterium]TAH08656.1 MAG: hypothetical protein EAZ13_02975 [Sphingobacteriia bacterium]
MKFFISGIITLIVFIGIYNIWVVVGVPPTDDMLVKIEVDSASIQAIGKDSGRGNTLCIQPFMTAINYANEPSFRESIRPYLIAARSKQLLNAKTLVVLPENIGNFLVAYEEKESLYKKNTVEEAVNAIIAGNIFKFSIAYFNAPSMGDKKKYALFQMKAKQIVEVYNRVFSNLAKEFKVSIAAGSIVLPNPSIASDCSIKLNKGELYHTYAVFNPDGKIVSPLEKKIFELKDSASFGFSVENRKIKVDEKNIVSVGFSGLLWNSKGSGEIVVNTNNTQTVLVPIEQGRMVNIWN